MCKAPRPGTTKTRLAALLGAAEAAALSACFLRDVASVIESVPDRLGPRGYGIYAPADAEDELRALLPRSFGFALQANADFGAVLLEATRYLLGGGHDCSILINSDSPTLPPSLLVQAIQALREPGDRVVLGPATDGGYYLIGLKVVHQQLFRGIPWSTAGVYRHTVERARNIGLPIVTLPFWYDIDDASTFSVLQQELAGIRPAFAEPGLVGAPAAATRAFIASLGANDAVIQPAAQHP
jgi:hypothetical protein